MHGETLFTTWPAMAQIQRQCRQGKSNLLFLKSDGEQERRQG